MKIKNFIWEKLLDPFVLRLESRISHYQSLRAITHDGSRWKDIADIGESVVFYTEAALINVGERRNLIVGSNSHIRIGQLQDWHPLLSWPRKPDLVQAKYQNWLACPDFTLRGHS
jgi:hypothetical protein